MAQQQHCQSKIDAIVKDYNDRFSQPEYKVVFTSQYAINGKDGGVLTTEMYKNNQTVFIKNDLMDVLIEDDISITVMHESKTIFIKENASDSTLDLQKSRLSLQMDSLQKYITSYNCQTGDNRLDIFFATDAFLHTGGLQKQEIFLGKKDEIVEFRFTLNKGDYIQEERMRIKSFTSGSGESLTSMRNYLFKGENQLHPRFEKYTIKDLRSHNNL